MCGAILDLLPFDDGRTRAIPAQYLQIIATLSSSLISGAEEPLASLVDVQPFVSHCLKRLEQLEGHIQLASPMFSVLKSALTKYKDKPQLALVVKRSPDWTQTEPPKVRKPALRLATQLRRNIV